MKVTKNIKIIIITILFIIYIISYPYGMPAKLPTAILCMLFGSLSFDFYKDIDKNKVTKDFSIIISVTLICCMIGCYSPNSGISDYFLFLLFIPCLFIDLLPDNFILNKLLRSRIMLFLGEISFPLYLLHSPLLVFGIFNSKLEPFSLYFNIILYLLLCIFIAYTYYLFVDKPLYTFLKSKISRLN